MLPYINIPPLPLGPLTLHMFGLLVATGVVVGTWLGARYGERNEIDSDWLRWGAFRVVVGGFIICHIFDVVFYQPDKLASDPLLLFKLWQGISSFGGFIGGLIMFMWITQKKYDPPGGRLHVGDCFMYGMGFGFWFGRMACATAHDHLGNKTDFVLAVTKPVRLLPYHNWKFAELETVHDLGLYEALFLMPAIVLGLVLIGKWKKRKPGHMVAWLTMAYAPPRFFMDYLRQTDSDPRYLGLTPAQHMAIALFAAGAFVLLYLVPRQPKLVVELAAERRAAREAAEEERVAKKGSKVKSESKKVNADRPKAKAAKVDAMQKGKGKGQSKAKKKRK